jgi:hypothetical protein
MAAVQLEPSLRALITNNNNNSAVINNTDTAYILTASEWSLLIPSLPQEIWLTNPLFKKHITIPCHLDNPLRMCKKMFCSVLQQQPISHRKNCTHFLLILTTYANGFKTF